MAKKTKITWQEQTSELQKDAVCIKELQKSRIEISETIGKGDRTVKELLEDSKKLNAVAYKIIKGKNICQKCGQEYPNPLCRYEC